MLVDIGGQRLWQGSTWAEDGDPTQVGAAGLWSAWQSSDHTWAYEDPNGTWGGLAPIWDSDPETWATMWNITDRLIEYKDAAIHDKIEERSTAKVRVKDTANAYMFSHGQQIVIRDEEMNIQFGGIVVESIATRLSSVLTPSGREHSISCTDYHYLAEHRIFNKAYVAPTPGQIFRDIVGALAADGVTIGEIQEGDVLPDQLFPFIMCNQAADTVATLAGFVWWIGYDLKLYAVVRTSYPAAFDIVDGSEIQKKGLSLASVNPDYRNRQLYQGGKALTSTKTLYFAGDGATQVFSVGFPLARAPTVSLNGGLPLTMGIKGLNDTGYDWYWSEGDSNIYQDPTGTPLNGTTDRLKVEFVGSYSLIVQVDQQAEITRNQLTQGFGSGIVENIITDQSILNQSAAIKAAQQTLLAYAAQGLLLQYDTTIDGLAAGTVQYVTISWMGLDGAEFLIFSIDTKFLPGPNGTEIIWRTVQCCMGPVNQSWGKVLCGIANLGKASAIANVSQNNSIQGLTTFTKTWHSYDTPNPFISVVEGVLPSDANFPCLAWEDMFPYLVVYVGGVEYYRKPVISVTENLAGTEIDIVALLLTEEANVNISHVALWSGVNCTSTPGSGIEMDKQAFVKTKINLESLQFNFSELKGW
jgi:hypothetical protein